MDRETHAAIKRLADIAFWTIIVLFMVTTFLVILAADGLVSFTLGTGLNWPLIFGIWVFIMLAASIYLAVEGRKKHDE